VGFGFHVTGRDTSNFQNIGTAARTSGIVIRDSRITPRRDFGRGIYAMLLNGVDTFDSERVTVIAEGAQLVYVGDTERIGRIRFVDGFATAGLYSFSGPTGNNGTAWSGYVDVLQVQGNTFAGASATMTKTLPANTYVTRAAFDLLVGARTP
jgi:hypothetical protein